MGMYLTFTSSASGGQSDDECTDEQETRIQSNTANVGRLDNCAMSAKVRAACNFISFQLNH